MAWFSAQQWPKQGWTRAIAVCQSGWGRRLLLVAWLLVPLLSGFFDLSQQSLVAHDEGLYTTRAREMLLQQDWIHPWPTLHHKTPGSYWILALVFQAVGVNEVTARLPSVLASVVAGLLLYELARHWLGAEIALWSSLVLSTSFLWVQYSRFATPDVIFVVLILAGLLSLLNAETAPRYGQWLHFGAGLCWGLAFLVRSFLVALPLAALLPYLLLEHRRHRHLMSLGLYAGFGVGLLPTLLWLGAVWQRWEGAIVKSLTAFPLEKATGGNAPFSGGLFYFTSIELNMLPWGLFALIGGGLVWRQSRWRQQRWLLVGAPVLMYLLLGAASTHLHHYALAMYPLLALLAAIALETLRRSTAPWSRLTVRLLAVSLGLLGGVLLLGSGAILVLAGPAGADGQALSRYAVIALPLGLGWSLSGLLWLRSGHRLGWLVGLLLANWLTLSVAGAVGVLGNANPELKAFLQQPEIQSVLTRQAIVITPLHGKLDVLFRFYTPHYQAKLESVTALPATGYAWVWETYLDQVPVPYTAIGQYQQVYLIRLQGVRE